jgi:Cu(I)/Ag(I) efflux system membrane fusion protein
MTRTPLLIAAIAAALVVAVVATLSLRSGASHPTERTTSPEAADPDIAYWTCSMHPEVRALGPGECPKCKMDLVPVRKADIASGTIVVDEHRRQLIGVRLGAVEKRSLELTVRAAGRITWDESRLVDVAPRVGGWITALGADALGKRIAAGDPLLTLYSPELVAAEGDYLAALGGAAGLRDAARDRLARLGLDSAAIDHLASTRAADGVLTLRAAVDAVVAEKSVVLGARVESGMRALRLADPARLWVEAAIHQEDLGLVKPGMRMDLEIMRPEPLMLSGPISFIAPTIDDASHTARARVELMDSEGQLRPGMAALCRVVAPLGERLAVPDDAVVHAGEKRIVFRDLGGGRFQPAEVVVGAHVEDWTEIVSGLDAGDRIAVSGIFLLASESRIRTGTDAW